MTANTFVQNLVIEDCLVSVNLLRTFMIANIPSLISFNNQSVTPEERKNCENSLSPWLAMKKRSVKTFASVKFSNPAAVNNTTVNNGNVDIPSKSSSSFVDSIKSSLLDNTDTYIPSMGNNTRDGPKRNTTLLPHVVNTTQQFIHLQHDVSKEFDIAMKDIIKQAIVEISIGSAVYF